MAGWGLWLVGVAWAGCEGPVSRAEVAQVAEAVWTGFVEVEPEQLAEARRTLSARLPCVTDRLTPVEAAAVHRARAVEAFADGDAEAVRRSLAALVRLDPRWRPPEMLRAPHPLGVLFDEARLRATSPETLSVDWAPAGGWWVDGLAPAEEVLTLPTPRAFLLQIGSTEGDWLHVGHHLSPATVPVALAPPRDQPEARAARRRQIRIAAGAGGGALLATGVALWAAGLADALALRSGEVVPADVQARQVRANALAGAGYGVAGAGAVLMGVGLAIRW